MKEAAAVRFEGGRWSATVPTEEEEAGALLDEKLSIRVSTSAYRRLAKPGIRTHKEERHSSPAWETCRS